MMIMTITITITATTVDGDTSANNFHIILRTNQNMPAKQKFNPRKLMEKAIEVMKQSLHEP